MNNKTRKSYINGLKCGSGKLSGRSPLALNFKSSLEATTGGDIMNKLSLDLGGSAIRTKRGNSKVEKMNSEFERISKAARIYTDDIEDKYADFTIETAPRADIADQRYARGEATNFLRGVSSQVDNNTLKVDQSETYVNAAHAIAVDADKNGQDDPKYTIGVCIPTSEFFSAGSDRIKEQLIGKYTVKFNLKDKVVNFEVENVVVYPEGVVALGMLFKDQKIAGIIKSKTGIVIDAGRRSTDVTIFKNGRPVAGAARSLPVGGINLEALTAIKLETSGFMAAGDSLIRAIDAGYLIDGNNTVSVGVPVQEAKKMLGSTIVKYITEVLAAHMIQLRELSYVVFLGRCFNISGDKTDRYTGDLGKEIIEGLNLSITRIDVDSNEFANINAVAAALERVAV